MITVQWATETFQFQYGVAIGIQKDFNRSDDGSILSERHNISIKGNLIASGVDAESRYANLILKTQDAVSKVNGGSTREATIQDGRLVVSGSSNLLEYDSARLMGISVGDPAEDTAGIHTQEISLTFETFHTPSDPASVYKLRSASESIEYRKEDNGMTIPNNDIHLDTEPHYSYSLVHTVSAQGYYDNLGISKSEAFEQAYKYVNQRKQDSIDFLVSTDVFNRPFLGASNVDAKKYKISGNTSHLAESSEIDLYSQYNVNRVSSTDIPSGSYSITTTFTLSNGDTSIDLTGEYSRQENGDVAISVQGTLQGLSTKSVTSTSHNKFEKARLAYLDMSGDLKSSSKIYKYAEKVYDLFQSDKIGIALRDMPISVSVGENKINGTVTFNVSYKVYAAEFVALLSNITGAITATSTISDTNRSGAGQDVSVIAEIPIPGRGSLGPIIQDMSTTTSRKRSCSIEVTLEPRYRTAINELVRTQVITEMDQYKPVQTSRWVQTFTENWVWTEGKYSANLEWTYSL